MMMELYTKSSFAHDDKTNILHLEVGENGYNISNDDAIRQVFNFLQANFRQEELVTLTLQLQSLPF